jgi:hypothetical protein
LAERLGFEFNGSAFSAKNLQDLLMPGVEINCTQSFSVERFTPPPLNVTLVQETLSQQPVAVAARIGDGTAIFLGAAFNPP